MYLRVMHSVKVVSVLSLLLVVLFATMLTACSRRRVHAAEPSYGMPYLTWQGDPSTTMTITYHTETEPGDVVAVYDIASAPESYSGREGGSAWQISGLPDGRYINAVELTGLVPGQDYYFRIGDGDSFSEEYKFRTMPEGETPFRFAIGGDTLPTTAFKELIIATAVQAPLFLVIGGDLSYADGDFERVGRWNAWFDHWHEHAVTSDGRLIPLVLAIGNHEVNKLEGSHEVRAPFYFGLFPQGGKTWWSLQFGDLMGLVVLDTDHLVSHEAQAAWLEEQLQAHGPLSFRTAVYHVPLYPSHRDFDGPSSVAGRTHWLPLFDKYRLSVGFENHDHTFKRTKRLRNNEIHEAGTLYVGDGNAGVRPRVPKTNLWYMEKVSRDAHFWIVDVSEEQMYLRALDRNGKVFDEVSVLPDPLLD